MPMPPTLFSAALPPYKPCCHSHRSFSSLGKPCLGNHASWRRLGNRGQCAQYEQILTAAPSAATAQPETFDAWYRNKDFESPQRYIGPIKTHLFPGEPRHVDCGRDGSAPRLGPLPSHPARFRPHALLTTQTRAAA